MKNFTFVFFAFFLLFIVTIKNVYSQDSLYLVDTLTGTATNNKLSKVEGIGDFNGDGYADFIVCYDQYVDLYFGNARFKPKLAHRFYLPPSNMYFGGVAYGIGDVNGDGYADLMIITGDTLYYPIYPYAEIILGGKDLDTIPKFKYYPPYYWHMLMSYKVYPLGDLNRDGYNEFAIASPYNWDNGLGRVYIFKGGKTLVDTPWVVLKGPRGINDFFYGYSVLGIGDQNNDSLSDFLVRTQGDSMNVYLYLGNKDTINMTPYTTYGPYTYISEVKAAGDLNGNGEKDFIITADGRAYIYLGYNNSIIYDAAKSDIGGFIAAGTGGDINGDGYDDFLIGNTNYRNSDNIMVGDVVGFWGSKSIDTSIIAFKMEGTQKWSEYGRAIDIVGDINGDGYADVFILQRAYSNYTGSIVGKLYIYSYVKITKVNNNDIHIPIDFKLNQNYPNPFNPSTVISYQLSAVSYVTLKIFNSLGQEVATLVTNEMEYPGEHKIEFDAEKYNLSSGVYFLKMNAAEINSQTTQYHNVVKMLYLK